MQKNGKYTIRLSTLLFLMTPFLKYMTHRAVSFFGVRGVYTFISCSDQSCASWMNRFRPLDQFGRLTICRLHGPLNLLIKLNL